jgi:hypothetical protein
MMKSSFLVVIALNISLINVAQAAAKCSATKPCAGTDQMCRFPTMTATEGECVFKGIPNLGDGENRLETFLNLSPEAQNNFLTNINYFDEDILELQNSDKEKAESIETNEDVKE